MKTFSNILKYTILILLALFMIFPFVWLFITSIKVGDAVFKIKSLADINPWPDFIATIKSAGNLFAAIAVVKKYFIESFSSFYKILKTVPLIPKFLGNTVIITFWGVIGNLFISSLAAYPLARFKFPGKNVIFFVFIATMMLPVQTGMIVNFITIRKLGLFDTYLAVIIPSLVSVFGIFLLRQAYLTIPNEIEDAARLDGCGELKLWWNIMLPLTRPALGTLAIFSFVAHWNTFVWPLVVLKTESKYPYSVGLSYLANMFDTNFKSVAAGSVISMVPIIIIFVLMQKQFIKGITAGAVK